MDEKGEKSINDYDERFKDDPDAIHRIYSVISYFLVLVVIGVPVWWHTTKVYRADLPLEEMINLSVPNRTIRPDSIPLSLDYDILVTVVNPEPQKLQVNFDITTLQYNLNLFTKNLEDIANFTTKSQWLYMVSLGEEGPGEVHFHERDLTHIITPLEKKTWAHMSPRPVLNLVLYFAKCETPLFMYTNDEQKVTSNAFLNLRWGGVTVINADKKSCAEGVFEPDLQPIIGTFYSQLHELFYLKSSSQEDIEKLKLIRAWEMVDSARRTLKSLAQLLMEINSIVISDDVARRIKLALENANKAADFLQSNNVKEGLKAAKTAYGYSESAFSDPSLLALLYFPDDQKYAVYIPLFLPIMIPVFMSLVTIKKWYSKQTSKNK